MVVDIGTVLLNMQSAGVFSYLLPFLLIFALVFAILQKTKILSDQKPISIIIAIAIGFLSLQLNFVSTIFPELFSRLGVGIAVLLLLMIFVGVFASGETWENYVYIGVGGIIFIVILVQAFDRFGWSYGGAFSGDLIGWFVLALVVIGVIVAVALSNSSGSSDKPKKGN